MIPTQVADVLSGRSRYALINGDGFELARQLPDSVDLVVGDPPYDEQTHEGARTDKSPNASPIDFDVCPPPETFVPALLRCARRWVILFCAAEMLGDYKRAANADNAKCYIRGGIWHKTNAMPQKTGDRGAQWGEAIAILHREDKMRWNGGGKQAFYEGPKCDDPTRRHPTKKPDWLMQAILRDYAEPDNIVFDPTMGEASTGEACLKLGLRFIGCEINPIKFGWAEERMRRAEKAGKTGDIFARVKPAKSLSLF